MKRVSFGPLALTTSYTTNLMSPGTYTPGVGFTANVFFLLQHVHVVNKTAGAVSYRLWKGASSGNAAGTEVAYDLSVAAHGVSDLFTNLRFEETDFLVGGASATGLSLFAVGELWLR